MTKTLLEYKRLILLLCFGAYLLSTIFTPFDRASASEARPQVAAQAGGPIYKYLILQGTGGPVACGDSLMAVYAGKRTGDLKRDETTALNSLFTTPKNSGGLYNPLFASRLKVKNVQYNQAKNAVINLGGKFVRPTQYCEVARARAVVWATAQQFPEVRHATIWYGRVLLGDLLEAKNKPKD